MLQHRFVEFMPETLEEGVLYVSMEYCTAIHNCVCGCGNKVVTPISPTDWQLQFNGKSVSLKPSIGNWSFDCQSHYWITNNKVSWAGKWDKAEIEEGRRADQDRKQNYFEEQEVINSIATITEDVSDTEHKTSWWKVILKSFGIK
jgi:hypothetical protein